MGKRKILICSTGLPGSGKGVLAEAANELGLPVISMGDIVRRETAKMKGVIATQSVMEVMKEYREKFGMDVFARLTAKEIEKEKSQIVFIDGVRCPEEIEFFRSKDWKIVVIAVLASPRERFRRLLRRRRVDDIESYDEFLERDRKELELGLWRVIIYADKFFVNEGITREEALKEAVRIIKDVLIEIEKES